jgi:hypothetical protein
VPHQWRVRRDFYQILRAKQQTNDRQRMLVHGQDENSGRNYLMVEGTDAKVYFVHYTRKMEEARSGGELHTSSFVRVKKLSASRALVDVIRSRRCGTAA